MSRYLLYSVFLLILLSCNPVDEKLIGDPVTRENFEKLSGLWKMEKADVFEQWFVSSDKATADVYVVKEQDTSFTEQVNIRNRKGSIYYEATVFDQNEGKPVPFRLSNSQKGKMIFVNEKHDFPQKIIYTLVSDNNLEVTISGNSEGEPQEITFTYFRFSN